MAEILPIQRKTVYNQSILSVEIDIPPLYKLPKSKFCKCSCNKLKCWKEVLMMVSTSTAQFNWNSFFFRGRSSNYLLRTKLKIEVVCKKLIYNYYGAECFLSVWYHWLRYRRYDIKHQQIKYRTDGNGALRTAGEISIIAASVYTFQTKSCIYMSHEISDNGKLKNQWQLIAYWLNISSVDLSKVILNCYNYRRMTWCRESNSSWRIDPYTVDK